jgi:hypothetical protein
MSQTTIFLFRHRRHPGRGPWRILRHAARTLTEASRTAKGWRATGAEVEIIPTPVPITSHV